MFVLDVADDFLDQILDGDDAVGAGIFVDHHRKVRAACAHVGQHVKRAARLRHEQRLAHQRLPVSWRLLAQREEGKDVLDVNHADDGIERLAVDRQAAVAVLGKRADDFLPCGRGRQGDDLAARNGDIVGIVLAEMQQIAQHLTLDRREIAVARDLAAGVILVLVDDFLKLRAQRLFAVTPIEEPADGTPKRAPTVRFSRTIVRMAAIFGHFLLTPL